MNYSRAAPVETRANWLFLCDNLVMTPAALRSFAGSLVSPHRATPKAQRQAARATSQPQTAAPAHANGVAKPDTAVLEALSQGVAVPEQTSSQQRRYTINHIPVSRWENGIPAVMGAHLMASGAVSPVSTSKGAKMLRSCCSVLYMPKYQEMC